MAFSTTLSPLLSKQNSKQKLGWKTTFLLVWIYIYRVWKLGRTRKLQDAKRRIHLGKLLYVYIQFFSWQSPRSYWEGERIISRKFQFLLESTSQCSAQSLNSREELSFSHLSVSKNRIRLPQKRTVTKICLSISSTGL